MNKVNSESLSAEICYYFQKPFREFVKGNSSEGKKNGRGIKNTRYGNIAL